MTQFSKSNLYSFKAFSSTASKNLRLWISHPEFGTRALGAIDAVHAVLFSFHLHDIQFAFVFLLVYCGYLRLPVKNLNFILRQGRFLAVNSIRCKVGYDFVAQGRPNLWSEHLVRLVAGTLGIMLLLWLADRVQEAVKAMPHKEDLKFEPLPVEGVPEVFEVANPKAQTVVFEFKALYHGPKMRNYSAQLYDIDQKLLREFVVLGRIATGAIHLDQGDYKVLVTNLNPEYGVLSVNCRATVATAVGRRAAAAKSEKSEPLDVRALVKMTRNSAAPVELDRLRCGTAGRASRGGLEATSSDYLLPYPIQGAKDGPESALEERQEVEAGLQAGTHRLDKSAS